MKKSTIWIVVIAAVALCAVWVSGKYNGLVKLEENVTAQWGQVENAYQRRLDLLPNLVETVRGYADHENATLVEVAEARAKATAVTVSPEHLDEASLEAYQAAQNSVSSALGRLMVIREQYPELKADKMFIELQTQLEGTENRISVARDLYNEAAREYNTEKRRFPTNIVAGICGFESKAYFKADAEASKAPKISFRD